MKLHRTERLIDAVKLVHLLELMAGKNALLEIRKENDIWKLHCEMNGKTIEGVSVSLSELAGKAIDLGG